MRKILVLLISVLAALPLVAQPVFTADNLPEIGYEAMFKADTSEEIIVDVGATGGPQTWDFSREVFGESTPFEVLDPEDTPAGVLFPDAEFTYHLAGTLIDTLSGEIWQYYKTTSTEMLMLGDYIESYHPILDSIKITHNYEPDRMNSVFPLQMGAQWQDFFHTVDSLDPTGVFTIETTSSSSSRVDAWGAVITPADSFDEALRYVTYDTTDIIVRIMAVPDTILSRTINYTWVAADVGPVMLITSLEDEINPEFDTASSYRVLTSYEAIAERPEPELAPLLRIAGDQMLFNITQSGNVELNIYDAAGCRRDVLYRGALSAGEHSLPLPSDLPRGVYFIRINTSGGILSGKFVVLD